MASDKQAPQESGDVDLAQAFKDLARGEQTAAALERQLSSMEKKIEELLAQAEHDSQQIGELSSREQAPSSSREQQQQQETDPKQNES